MVLHSWFSSCCSPPYSNIPPGPRLTHHCHLHNAPELAATSAPSRPRDAKLNLINFHFFSWGFEKLFLKQLSLLKKKNTSKTTPLPKLLVYPICQGIGMSVMRTQRGSVMKAITHRQRKEPLTCTCGFVIYFPVTFGEKKAPSEIQEEKESWLMSHRGREPTTGSSRRIQRLPAAGEMMEIGSGSGRKKLKRPSSI